MNYSNNFEIECRILTGVKFFLDMQSADLKIGVISANFNFSWYIQFVMQELNMPVSIGA